MRNRGIELFMLPDPYQLTPSPQPNPSQALPLPPAALRADSATVADAHSLLACELESVMSADGVPGRQPAACLAAAHLQLVEQAAKLHRYGFSQSLCGLLSQQQEVCPLSVFVPIGCLGMDQALQETGAVFNSSAADPCDKDDVRRLSISGS